MFDPASKNKTKPNKNKLTPKTSLSLFRKYRRFARLLEQFFSIGILKIFFQSMLKSRKNLTGHWNTKYGFNKKAGRSNRRGQFRWTSSSFELNYVFLLTRVSLKKLIIFENMLSFYCLPINRFHHD